MTTVIDIKHHEGSVFISSLLSPAPGADDNTLMTESEEELKSLWMKVKEENEEVDLKLNIQKTKIIASGSITSWQIDGEKNGNNERFYSGGLQNHCRW